MSCLQVDELSDRIACTRIDWSKPQSSHSSGSQEHRDANSAFHSASARLLSHYFSFIIMEKKRRVDDGSQSFQECVLRLASSRQLPLVAELHSLSFLGVPELAVLRGCAKTAQRLVQRHLAVVPLLSVSAGIPVSAVQSLLVAHCKSLRHIDASAWSRSSALAELVEQNHRTLQSCKPPPCDELTVRHDPLLAAALSHCSQLQFIRACSFDEDGFDLLSDRLRGGAVSSLELCGCCSGAECLLPSFGE
jgi:hypothetical protein